MNSQNIKQNFGTQVNFISEIKPQKERFLAKYDCFFGNLCIWDKYLEYKTSNQHTSDLRHGKEASKKHCLAKKTLSFW